MCFENLVFSSNHYYNTLSLYFITKSSQVREYANSNINKCLLNSKTLRFRLNLLIKLELNIIFKIIELY